MLTDKIRMREFARRHGFCNRPRLLYAGAGDEILSILQDWNGKKVHSSSLRDAKLSHLAVPVHITLGFIPTLNHFKVRRGAGEAVLATKHFLNGGITLGGLPAVIPDAKAIGAFDTDPFRFSSGIAMVIEFHVRSHLLALLAEVSLLLMDHGLGHLLFFKLGSFVGRLGTGGGLKARLE